MEDRYVCTSPPSARFMLKFCPSHLNLVRSVTTVLEIMSKAMKEQQERLQRQQRTLSPSQDIIYDFSDKHKLLQSRLQPLTHVQRDLEKCLGSAALEPDQVPTANNVTFPDSDGGHPRRNMEFPSVNSSWKARLLGKGDSKKVVHKRHTQDLHNAAQVLYHCGSDIKQLWADDVVQQVLIATNTQLKHSSGL